MFKFGIFRLEDYRPESTSLSGRLAWMLTRHRISLQLLRTGIPASPREITVFEALMQGLRLNSGIYRTTFHNRFRDLDPFVNELLAERFDAAAAIEVHDWAASDCLTSSEWAASLLALFPNARLTASDLTLFLVEVAWVDDRQVDGADITRRESADRLLIVVQGQANLFEIVDAPGAPGCLTGRLHGRQKQ